MSKLVKHVPSNCAPDISINGVSPRWSGLSEIDLLANDFCEDMMREIRSYCRHEGYCTGWNDQNNNRVNFEIANDFHKGFLSGWPWEEWDKHYRLGIEAHIADANGQRLELPDYLCAHTKDVDDPYEPLHAALDNYWFAYAMLATIETHVLTEQAYRSLDIDSPEAWERSFKSGVVLFSLCRLQAKLSTKAVALVESLIGLLPNAEWADGGFHDAKEKFETYGDQYSQTHVDEMEEDPRINYEKELALKLKVMATELAQHAESIKHVTCYNDLLTLDPAILSLLVRFEELRTEKLESADESIDFRSSGHHQDQLDIYRNALKGEEFPVGCFIYMADNGKLRFNPHDDISRLQ